jgi:hypothetical protein
MARQNYPARSLSIPFRELDGSPTESWGPQGFTATRRLRCAWADRLLLAAELRGGVVSLNRVDTYFAPQSYPGFAAALVGQVEIAPLSAGIAAPLEEGNCYAEAVLTVRYEVPQELTQEAIQPTLEFQTVPSQRLYWDAAHTQQLGAEQAPALLRLSLAITRKRRQLVNLPQAFWELSGHTNMNPVRFDRLGTFAAGHLLYQPGPLDRVKISDGLLGYDATLLFSFRAGGWNRFSQTGASAPQPIYLENGQYYQPYPNADFNLLMEI